MNKRQRKKQHTRLMDKLRPWMLKWLPISPGAVVKYVSSRHDESYNKGETE